MPIGHAGDEQGEHQPADRAEAAARVVGQAAPGDQRGRTAGAAGHQPRADHRQPRAGDDQPGHDEQDAGEVGRICPGVVAGGRHRRSRRARASRQTTATAARRRGGLGVARRVTPSGEIVTRRSASRAASAATTGTPRPTTSVVSQASARSPAKNGVAGERDRRQRPAGAAKNSPKPRPTPATAATLDSTVDDHRDLPRRGADQSHRGEPLLAPGGREPGRGADEDQHREQQRRRDDGEDQVDAVGVDADAEQQPPQSLRASSCVIAATCAAPGSVRHCRRCARRPRSASSVRAAPPRRSSPTDGRDTIAELVGRGRAQQRGQRRRRVVLPRPGQAGDARGHR